MSIAAVPAEMLAAVKFVKADPLIAGRVAIVGFGYVPVRFPPAAPTGGALLAVTALPVMLIGARPAERLAGVRFVRAAPLIAGREATAGFGYVPERSPPAGPVVPVPSNSEINNTPVAPQPPKDIPVVLVLIAPPPPDPVLGVALKPAPVPVIPRALPAPPKAVEPPAPPFM
jgi:hypothetical protein